MALQQPKIDPCVYDGKGRTPYMAAEAGHEKLVDCLRPVVTWEQIEECLEDAPLDLRPVRLAELVPVRRLNWNPVRWVRLLPATPKPNPSSLALAQPVA